ncbi:MAG: ATP-binding protein [Treponema sp.]|jgi:predicted AAA+ superfamily ATPase|nr:ATP-binding protein [Treponema sp.]
MKLSEIREVGVKQKVVLEARDSGLERTCLASLPDIQSHALIVSGIRRCGKSTLLHQFVKKLGRLFFYFNFDDLRLHDFSVADFQLLDRIIGESDTRLLFFDEVQSAEHWELYVRQKLDEGFQVIITGSNASLLSHELGTKLTGRHLSKELFPFSYQEYCRFINQESPGGGVESLDRYLEQGGFPEYLKTNNLEILTQLQSDILYRDIAIRYGIRDVSSLHRLFLYLLSNAAQLVSPSKLTQVAGVKSATTVLEYFSYFQSAYLIDLAPCFAWSAKAVSLAPKKLYIVDPGIIQTGSASFTDNHGALLENFVFNSLRLHTRDLYYFARENRECDFIVDPHQGKGSVRQPCCMQVCRELTTENQDREIQGLIRALEFFGQDQGVIITRDTEDLILKAGKKIAVVPAWKYDFAGITALKQR